MPDRELIDHIRASTLAGKSKEEIYIELLEQGRSVDEIQEGYAAFYVADSREATQKKTVQIIIVFGAILIGAGIFSFVASNWQQMTKPVKIALIVTSMLAAYVTGWHLRERLAFFKSGEALLLLGSVIYGAGIFLIGQMFHVRSNWPDGFILWMIGTLAMAFAVESFSLFFLAISLAIVSLIGHPFGILGALDSYNPFLLTSSFLLLAATVVTFVAGCIIRKKLRSG